jgi:hypothetical protein
MFLVYKNLRNAKRANIEQPASENSEDDAYMEQVEQALRSMDAKD